MIFAMAVAGFAIITDNVDAVDAEESSPVAKIGDKEYETLEAAVSEAKAGDTITILSDIVLEKSITLSIDMTIELDGKTISAPTSLFKIYGADVTIENGSLKTTTECDGKVAYTAIGVGAYTLGEDVRKISSLTANNLTINAAQYGIGVFGAKTNSPGDHLELRDQTITDDSTIYSSVKLNNCDITAEFGAVSTNGNYGYEEITIIGGSLKSNDSVAFYLPSNAKTYIQNCKIEGISGFDQRAGILEIEGGSITYNGPAEEKESGDGPVDFGTAIQIVNATGYSQADVVTTINGTKIIAGSENVFGDVCFGINRNNGEKLTIDAVKKQGPYETTRNMTLTIDGMTFSIEKGSQTSISYITSSEVMIGTGTTVDITSDLTSESTVVCNGTLNVSNATVSIKDVDDNSTGILNVGADGIVLSENATGAKSMKFNGTFAHVLVNEKECYSYSDLQFNLNNVTAWEKENGDVVSKRVYVFGTYALNDDVIVPSGVDLKVQATNADKINKEGSALKSIIDLNKHTITLESGSQIIGKIANGEDFIVFTELTKSSGFSIASGSIIIDGNVVSDTSGDVVISGDAVITGNVKVDGNIIVKEGSSLNISEGSKITADGITIENGASESAKTVVNIAGTINANITATAADKISITVTPEAKINGTVSDSIKDDVASVTWETVTLSGVLESTFTGKDNQIVVITGDLSIRSDMIINGKLVIESDAVVTIENGASISFGPLAAAIIDGSLIINEGSTFTIVGDANSMTVNGDVQINGTGVDINANTTVNGSIVITEEGAAKLNKVVISKDAALTVNGKLAGTVILNGTATIDSVVESATAFTIQMRSGASVDAENYNGTVTITDDGMKYRTGGVDQPMVSVNAMSFTNISGISIVEDMEVWTEDGVRKAVGIMTVSGNVKAMTDEQGEALAGAAINFTAGTVEITEMTVGKATVYISNGAEIEIVGTLTMSEKDYTVESKTSASTEPGKVSIDGTLITRTVIDSDLDLNAASYKDKVFDVEYNYYTTLENAVASGATAITTFGAIVVENNLTVPIGVKITMNSGSTIEISEDSTVTFVQGSKLDTSGKKVTVDGSLIIEDASKNGYKDADIIADVDKKNGDEKVYTMTYTNIFSALEAATDGETVTLRSDEVTVDKNVSVPAGVVLLIENDKKLTVDKATMTVDGKVDAVDGTFVISNDSDSKVIVNGIFQYDTITGITGKVAGAYFLLENVNTIAPLTYAAENIDIIDSDVTVYLVNTVLDITMNYTNGGNVSLIVAAGATLVADTITLKNVVFNAASAKNVDAKVVLTNGTIDFENVTGMTFADKITYDADNTPIYTAQVSGSMVLGTISSGTASSGKITFDGSVEAAGAVAASIAVVIPADVTVKSTGYAINGSAEISGTLDAKENVTIKEATIYGTVTVGTGKTVTITTLFLGTAKDDILKTAGATATIAKGVALATNGVAYVAPGSVFDESFTESTLKTEFYVEDVLYLTAYAKGTITDKIADVTTNVDDAEFKGWKDGNTTIVNQVIGGVSKVSADLDYKICSIEVSSVPGVIVYIDGSEYDAQEKYTVGTHTIEVYLQYGYTGTPVIKANGSTVSGSFITVAEKTTQISVTGVTAIQPSEPVTPVTPSEKDDSMGLTEYLLIVLVILAAILVVVVAIRMMRS